MYKVSREKIASDEMVNELIDTYFEFAEIDEETDPVIQLMRSIPIGQAEIDEIITPANDWMKKYIEEIELYEVKLQQIIDLACALDSGLMFSNKDEYDLYLNYLMKKLPDVLMDTILLITALKNK